MKARTLPLLLAPALALGLLAAQEGTLKGTIEGRGFARVAIALPEPRVDGEASASQARELRETVAADLLFSGYFDVLDPSLHSLVTAPGSDGAAMEAWQSVGAAAVVLGRLGARGGRLDLEARLFDTAARSSLFARRYGGNTDLLRRLGHQLADDIVRQYTGRPGVALTRIAFVSSHGKGTKELYLMDYDGQRVRRLTTTGTLNLMPAWDPEGRRLAYVSWRSGRPQLYVVDEAGTRTTLRTVGGDLNTTPAWSPDGRKLAYTSDVDGNAEIYLLDLARGTSTRLTNSRSIDTSPTFSPTGREIAFTSDRSGPPQIYVMDAEGLNVRRLTHDGLYADAPAWSPTDPRIAYAVRDEGRFNIAVLDLTTGAVTRLTRGEGNNEDPRWSPDGRHLVFSSSRNGRYEIHTMAADGGGVRRLTQGVDSYTPDWSR